MIDPGLLARVRAERRCSWCGAPLPHGAEPHHIFGKLMGGGGRLDIPWNVVPLCLLCHRAHHDGNRPLRVDLLAVSAARHGVQQQDIVDEVNRLRRLPKEYRVEKKHSRKLRKRVWPRRER